MCTRERESLQADGRVVEEMSGFGVRVRVVLEYPISTVGRRTVS